MEKIKNEILNIISEYEIEDLEILVIITNDQILEEEINKLIENYKSWREDIEELLADGYEGTYNAGEIAAINDFLDWSCCGTNNIIKKLNNIINKDDNEYECLMNITYRILSELELYYYYNY